MQNHQRLPPQLSQQLKQMLPFSKGKACQRKNFSPSFKAVRSRLLANSCVCQYVSAVDAGASPGPCSVGREEAAPVPALAAACCGPLAAFFFFSGSGASLAGSASAVSGSASGVFSFSDEELLSEDEEDSCFTCVAVGVAAADLAADFAATNTLPAALG